MRLLLLERRCERDRRAATRIEGDIPATLTRVDDAQNRYGVVIAAASAGGFTLYGSDAPPPAGVYRGELDIGATRFPFEFTLRAANLGGAVRWPDDATRAAFDLALHLRAIEAFAATDRGDGGGVLRTGGVSPSRYPKARPSRAS
jgi:hypothetical protein